MFQQRVLTNGFGAVFFALALLCAAPAFAQQSMEEFRAEVAAEREMVRAMDRSRDPIAWAVAQTELAGRVSATWESGSFEESSALYREVLDVLSPETNRSEWLAAQEGLANALLQQASARAVVTTLAMRTGGPSDLGMESRDAANAFRIALAHRTRESDHVAWARSQIGLGYALSFWMTRQIFAGAPEAETRAIFSEAESTLRQGVDALTLRENPAEWAAAHEGLIMLFSTAATMEDQKYVEDEEALQRSEAVRTRYIRSAIEAAEQAARGYESAGQRELAENMGSRIEQLREDLRPNRRVWDVDRPLLPDLDDK